MNFKTWIPLIVAVALGAIALKIAHDVSGKKNPNEGKDTGVRVVVAKEMVSPGAELTSEQLTLAPIAGNAMPAKAYATPQDLAGRVVTPGCRIDILTTVSGQNEGEKTMTRAIVENILITAVGTRLTPQKPEGDKDSGYKTITLVVTPREAELIELANTSARTRIVLRAHGDNRPLEQDGVTLIE